MTAPADLSQQQTQAVQNTRLRVLAVLAAMWLGLRSWRGTDVDRFLSSALPVLLAGQQLVARMTEAYLRQALALLGASRGVAGIPAEQVSGAALRGVDPTEVYRRPFNETWTALSQGVPFDEALRRGEARLRMLVATDLQLAKTHTARAVLSTAGIAGYRRVLNGPHSCGLCIVASTQRYHSVELMPIHPGCDCGIAPIVGGVDPGRVIDEQALAGAHAAIRERFGAQSFGAREIGDELNAKGEPLLYRDVLITHEHGEIGPVLAVRGQNFAGPDDIGG